MKTNNIIELIKSLNLTNYGDVYLFGSFIKNKGLDYNDIDIYIDSDISNIDEISTSLKSIELDYKLSPSYYSTLPKPRPIPPFPIIIPKPEKPPKPKPSNNILHITVCKKVDAMNQLFYKAMINGEHIILDKKVS